MKEVIDAFKGLRGAPLALWLAIFAYSGESMAYFGFLPLMKAFLGKDVGIPPAHASVWVSCFSGSLTLVMLFVAKPAEDKLGVRKGILLALLMIIAGRALYSSTPMLHSIPTLAFSLGVVAIGEGILQPLCYAAVKKYTTAQNGAMGYAAMYALFNLGAALVGPISSSVRTTYDEKRATGLSSLSGFNAVNWVCVGITVLTLVIFAGLMTPSREAQVVREGENAEAAKQAPGRSPLLDPRFMFFIFALLPVRTLFAHQFLTMPEYVLRAYPKDVGDKMEWLVNSINPIIIFFGVPLITAVFKRFHVLTMMLWGSAVTAGATFLLVGGANTQMLILYFFVFSVGEALWSSRFFEYAGDLAPPGRAAQYLGVAQMPWFVAKVTTGLYSGTLLEKYCPENGPKDTGTLWLIYGGIAIFSPVLLFSARKWLLAGMQPKEPAPAPTEA